MFDVMGTAAFWASLLGVTLIQVALGADNLIIITIIANKLPREERGKAIKVGLALAMLFRIALLAGVSFVLAYATKEFWAFDTRLLGVHVTGTPSGKALVLAIGGLFLIWKGIKELRVKLKGVHETAVKDAARFKDVVMLIVGMNLLFSVDSILTVVGMTDVLLVMIGSVVISVGMMLLFADAISNFLADNPEFEILGLFVLLLIGFVLVLEGGHEAHVTFNDSDFPHIPQWIVIFMLLLMFAVDLYQNWWERGQAEKAEAVHLHHRTK